MSVWVHRLITIIYGVWSESTEMHHHLSIHPYMADMHTPIFLWILSTHTQGADPGFQKRGGC